MKLNSFSVIDKIDHRTNVWVENADKRSLNFSFWLKRKKPKQYDSCKRSYFYFYSISLKDLLITDYIFIAYTPAFKELRIIVFSVVNMTEKLKCCQLDLGQFFLAWLIWRNHKERKKLTVEFDETCKFFCILYNYTACLTRLG